MFATITLFTKTNGPLTKRIDLVNGKPKSDGSACVMSRGTAQRITVTAREFADRCVRTAPAEAYGLGTLESQLCPTRCRSPPSSSC